MPHSYPKHRIESVKPERQLCRGALERGLHLPAHDCNCVIVYVKPNGQERRYWFCDEHPYTSRYLAQRALARLGDSRGGAGDPPGQG